MSDNWVVQTLNSSLSMWQNRLQEISTLLTTSPETFRGGGIWKIIVSIYNVMQGIGLGLLVLFFLIGVLQSCTSLNELRRPEQALRLFIRFAAAKGLVTYGLDLMLAIFRIGQGMIQAISPGGLSFTSVTTIPVQLSRAIDDCSFLESIPLWAVGLLCSLVVWALSIILILSVYGRFFKLYMYTALAPIPLSTFSGEGTHRVGVSFIKHYCGVILEGALIALACVIFTAFTTTTPTIDASAKAVSMVWSYMGEMIFNMLILVGTVRACDRLVHQMLGL